MNPNFRVPGFPAVLSKATQRWVERRINPRVPVRAFLQKAGAEFRPSPPPSASSPCACTSAAFPCLSPAQAPAVLPGPAGSEQHGGRAARMQTANKEHLYKLLVIGDLGVGKTSIIKRYVHQNFSSHYRATIGVDFALKVLHWDPETVVRLQLWDIAGEDWERRSRGGSASQPACSPEAEGLCVAK